MKLRALPLALLALGFVACSGGDDDGTDDNTNMPPGPRNVSALPGGGTSGGAISGVLTVFVLDEDDQPIADADVIVLFKGENLALKTNAEGRIDLNKDGLDKSLSLHVFKDGYAFTSAFGFDASVVTIALDDGREEQLSDPLIGTVTGTITGWDRLPANTMTSARVVQVGPIGQDVVDVMQKARPGTVTIDDPDGTAYNLVINGSGNFPSWTDYSVELDTRAKQVIALGGLFDLPNQRFDVTHLGVIDVDVTEGAVVMQNIDLDNAVDQDLALTASGVPMLDNAVAIFAVELADGSLLPMPSSTYANGMGSAKAPALSGDFASARYAAIFQARSMEFVGEEPAKSAVAFARGTEKMYTFDALLAPPNPPTATGRTIGTMPVAGSQLTLLELRNEDDDQVLWTVAIYGDTLGTVELPAVPTGLVDPLTGARILQATVANYGSVELNDVAFESLTDAPLATSASSRSEVSL